jgi:hypothetical protein
MVRHCAAERLVLCTAGSLGADEVRVCTAETGRTYHFMTVKHHLMLGSLLYHIHVVVDERLAVVVFSDREDIAYITALDRVVAIFVHKFESLVKVTLVVTYR